MGATALAPYPLAVEVVVGHHGDHIRDHRALDGAGQMEDAEDERQRSEGDHRRDHRHHRVAEEPPGLGGVPLLPEMDGAGDQALHPGNFSGDGCPGRCSYRVVTPPPTRVPLTGHSSLPRHRSTRSSASGDVRMSGRRPRPCRRWGRTEYPLEIVQKAPVEVAPDVDTGIDTALHAAQCPLDVVDPDLVVVGSDAVFGDVDRKARLVPRPTDGALEGLGPDLVSHLGGRDPLLTAQCAVGPDPHPGVGLDPDEVVSPGRLEEHVLGGASDPFEPLLSARLELVVGHRQSEPDGEVARTRPDGLHPQAVGGDQGVVDRVPPRPVRTRGGKIPRRHPIVATTFGSLRVAAIPIRSPMWAVARATEPGEPIRRLRGLPGAGGGQPSGVGEVVEGDHRHHPALVAGRGHPPVVVEGDKGELTLLRFDPAPLEREAVGGSPRSATRAMSSSKRLKESQASPLTSTQPEVGSCSKTHQSLLTLPPSI